MREATYKNKFYHPHNVYSREDFTCEVVEEDFKGFILCRRSHIEYHAVRDGMCIMMCAGINGLKRRILAEGITW